MSIRDLLSLAALKNTVSVGGIIFVILASLIQLSKININPWSWILGKLGDMLNANLKKRIDEQGSEIKEIRDTLKAHIAETEAKDLQDTRKDILNFANSCMNKRKHTKEEFDFVIAECDKYEAYIEQNNIKNGVITSAIREIHRLNDQCIQNNSFLKEQSDG